MSDREAASLTASLLVAKGAAAPIALSAERARRRPRDGGNRVSIVLDEAQHLRLRLAAAHLRRSRQAVLRDALEHYLGCISNEAVASPCGCLARSSLERIASCP